MGEGDSVVRVNAFYADKKILKGGKLNENP